MKTLLIKKMMPLAVFVLGIAGAFTTMSMQKTSVVSPTFGWADAVNEECSVRVSCETIGTVACQVSYPSGNIAYTKPGTVCLSQLYRP